MQTRVVDAPQFRALGLRVPLAELVAEREDALLRTRLFFVAARAADHRGIAVLLDGFKQRHRLRRVARIRLADAGARCRFLIESSTWPTTSSAPISFARRSRKSITSSKL